MDDKGLLLLPEALARLCLESELVLVAGTQSVHRAHLVSKKIFTVFFSFLCPGGAFLNVPYSFPLISNKFCNEGEQCNNYLTSLEGWYGS
jgi:hypothetical protein